MYNQRLYYSSTKFCEFSVDFIHISEPTWDCQTRINVLTTRLMDLRKTYHSVKAELAAIDRRRKKLRRKEREGRFLNSFKYFTEQFLYYFLFKRV